MTTWQFEQSWYRQFFMFDVCSCHCLPLQLSTLVLARPFSCPIIAVLLLLSSSLHWLLIALIHKDSLPHPFALIALPLRMAIKSRPCAPSSAESSPSDGNCNFDISVTQCTHCIISVFCCAPLLHHYSCHWAMIYYCTSNNCILF